MDDMLERLAQLTALAGPTGREDAVAKRILALLAAAGLEGRRDGAGNVVAGAERPQLLVTAHMDQVGYMVSRLEAEHALCLPVGGAELAPGERVAARILARGGERAGALRRVDADAECAELRGELEGVAVGDRVVFAAAFSAQDGVVTAPALDNRAGCAIVLQAAARIGPGAGVAFAWTVREESDCSGALAAAVALRPACHVAVDVTPALGDRTPPPDSPIFAGAGPVVTLLDGELVEDPRLVEPLDRSARRLGIALQREVVADGLSEAGRVQGVHGIPALALLAPVQDPHSARERVDLGDVEATAALLAAALPELVEAAGGLGTR